MAQRETAKPKLTNPAPPTSASGSKASGLPAVLNVKERQRHSYEHAVCKIDTVSRVTKWAQMKLARLIDRRQPVQAPLPLELREPESYAEQPRLRDRRDDDARHQ